MNIVMPFACACILVLAACAAPDQPEIGQQTWECPIELPRGSLAVDTGGRPVRFDSQTGTVIVRGEPETIQQLSFDALHARVLAVAATHDIIAFDSDLQTRRPLATAESGAWILPGPEGVIVFEPASGWHLLDAPHIAQGPPAPAAAWIDQGLLHALVPIGAALAWTSRALDAHDAPELHAGLEAPRPESARGVPAATLDGAIVADETDAGVRLRLVDRSGMVQSALVIEARDLVQLVGLGASARTERLALVLADPPTVAVADLFGRRRALATLVLASAPAPAHALIAPGADRLLVATEAGVLAIRIREEGSLALEPDPAFDGGTLRAPLGGPVGRRAF